jgi:hypothetical protein
LRMIPSLGTNASTEPVPIYVRTGI